MPLKIDEEKCIGCGVCIHVCPNSVLKLVVNEILGPDLKKFYCKISEPEKCTNCGRCVEECPSGALSISRDNATTPK
jgi:ferredoxin